jgi:DNA-binding transcriptional MerR regulator
MTEKSADAYRTISEVASDLEIPQHVLRFWETRFGQIKPLKRAGGRRYYRPEDVALLAGIRELLYGRGYTIRGVQKILRERGIKAIQAVGSGAPDAIAELVAVTPPLADASEPGDVAVECAAESAPVPDEAAGRQVRSVPPAADDIRRHARAALAELAECQRVLRLARSA